MQNVFDKLVKNDMRANDNNLQITTGYTTICVI